MVNIEKLNKLARADNNWLEEAKGRQNNIGWLQYSQKIAIKVLMVLRENKMTQKQLAINMGVSPQMINKIVKGKEKLNLESINNIEEALGISLIKIDNNGALVSKNKSHKKQNNSIYTNRVILEGINMAYNIPQDNIYSSFVNEESEDYGKNDKLGSYGFQLVNISTDKFVITEESYNAYNKEINLSISIEFGVNSDDRTLTSSVKLKFEQSSNAFLLLNVSHHYVLDNYSWNKFINNNKIILPKSFAFRLVVLTIGTIRGVLHTKTENTEFNKFVLQNINVAELVKSDIEIDFS